LLHRRQLLSAPELSAAIDKLARGDADDFGHHRHWAVLFEGLADVLAALLEVLLQVLLTAA